MNWDLAAWTVGGVCALITTIYGGKRIGRNAGGVTEDVDPNKRLIGMLDRAQADIRTLQKDIRRGAERLSDVERDLISERERSDRQDQQIRTLHDENRDLKRQLTLLQHAIAAWETWHRWLMTNWHELRQCETPPDGPQPEPAE